MTVGIAESVLLTSSRPLRDYYRCADIPSFGLTAELGQSPSFFRFGPEVICYGQTAREQRFTVNGDLSDVSQNAEIKDGCVLLPFDITQVVENLRYEAYVQANQRWVEKSWVKDLYYRFRPMLPISVRKHLQ